MTSFLQSIHDFLHARTSSQGCLIAGWMRVAYATLFLCSYIVFWFDVELLYSPTKGLMPYSIASDTLEYDATILFRFAPYSDLLVWAIYYVGLLSGTFLLLGIAPRLQLVLLLFTMQQLHRHDELLWSSQDVMLHMWAFFLLFLPLHRVTIYNVPASKDRDSWPMWPFRLWQIYTCFVYIGASFAKLVGEPWRDGTAMHVFTYGRFYGMLFNPDFLFNRLLPVKITTYFSLGLELVCWISIWPRTTRMATLIAIVLLHVGIDLAMNMDIFEYLSLVGWMPFLVEPASGETKGEKRLSVLRRFLDTLVFLTLVSIYFAQTVPFWLISQVVPEATLPFLNPVRNLAYNVRESTLPITVMLGIDSIPFTVFGPVPDKANSYHTAIVTLSDGSEKRWQSPDWKNMAWYRKKRYAEIETRNEYTIPYLWLLCEHLSKQYDNVSSVELFSNVQQGRLLPHDHALGWFDKLPRQWDEQEHELYYLEVDSSTRSPDRGQVVTRKFLSLWSEEDYYRDDDDSEDDDSEDDGDDTDQENGSDEL